MARATNEEIEQRNREQAEREAAENRRRYAPVTDPNAPVNSSPSLGNDRPWLAWSTAHPSIQATAWSKHEAHNAVSSILNRINSPIFQRPTLPTGKDFKDYITTCLGWERVWSKLGVPHVFHCPGRPELGELVWTIADDQEIDVRGLALLAGAIGLDPLDLEDEFGLTAARIRAMERARPDAVHPVDIEHARQAARYAEARQLAAQREVAEAEARANEQAAELRRQKAEREAEIARLREEADERARRRAAQH